MVVVCLFYYRFCNGVYRLERLDPHCVNFLPLCRQSGGSPPFLWQPAQTNSIRPSPQSMYSLLVLGVRVTRHLPQRSAKATRYRSLAVFWIVSSTLKSFASATGASLRASKSAPSLPTASGVCLCLRTLRIFLTGDNVSVLLLQQKGLGLGPKRGQMEGGGYLLRLCCIGVLPMSMCLS